MSDDLPDDVIEDELADDVLSEHPCPYCGAEMVTGELTTGDRDLRFTPKDASFFERVFGGSSVMPAGVFKKQALAAAICHDCNIGVFQSERDL